LGSASARPIAAMRWRSGSDEIGEPSEALGRISISVVIGAMFSLLAQERKYVVADRLG
jgi:hypothetical protein